MEFENFKKIVAYVEAMKELGYELTVSEVILHIISLEGENENINCL
jgi:hypothetical protein